MSALQKSEVLCIGDEVFCIPHHNKFIVYIPLRDYFIVVNPAFVKHLQQAAEGNISSAKLLGAQFEEIKEFINPERKKNSLLQKPDNKEFKPTEISLFLTGNCTMRCLYCYAHAGSTDSVMPINLAQAVINRIIRNAIDLKRTSITIHFHGGGDVSAIWSYFQEVVHYIENQCIVNNLKHKISVGINGVLNPVQQQWFVKHIHEATVSIDGFPDIHNAQRPLVNGQHSFSYVDSTLKYFDKHRFHYGIRCTVTQKSVNKLPEIIEFFCQQYNCSSIMPEPMYMRDIGHSELLPPNALEYVENFCKAAKVAKKYKRTISYSGARLDEVTPVFCKAVDSSCAVTPDGSVTSCYEVVDKNDPLSDTFIYGRFDMQKEDFEIDIEKRRKLTSMDVTFHERCQTCFCKWHCAGDCPVKAVHTSLNSPDKKPDRCFITQELTKDQILAALKLEGDV